MCITHVSFSINFGSHWVLFGIGSHAIRPRICSPNTLFSFCIFLKKGSLKTFKWGTFWTIFDQICDFCVKNGFQKLLQKKVPRQSQTSTYSQARRLPERQPRVRTVQTRNSCSSSSWSTVRDFCRKKWTGLKIGVKKWLGSWIVAKNTEWIVDVWKLMQV